MARQDILRTSHTLCREGQPSGSSRRYRWKARVHNAVPSWAVMPEGGRTQTDPVLTTAQPTYRYATQRTQTDPVLFHEL